jgi:uncharacterized membrane protein
LLFSSNRQGARDRIRSDIEYEINLKAELEVAHLHEKTDKMYEDVLDRLTRLEKLVSPAGKAGTARHTAATNPPASTLTGDGS